MNKIIIIVSIYAALIKLLRQKCAVIYSREKEIVRGGENVRAKATL